MRTLEASDDSDGLIGRLANGNVLRLPSSIYWLGLKVWGIRTFAGSQNEYHRSLDLLYARRWARRTVPGDFDGESASDADLTSWHPSLPAAPAGFPQDASFRLRRPEAECLRERLLTSCRTSLLAYLVRERIVVADAEFVWDLAGHLPAPLREPVEHGRNFSETMHGAQLLYNLMLAERKAWDGTAEEYRGRLGEWWNQLQTRGPDLSGWDRNRFWTIVFASNPRVTPGARRFIDAWIDLVQGATSVGDIIEEGTAARSLIEAREVRLKRNLARLTNPRPLEMWQGAAGAEQLDLRWRAARRLVQDILDGLEADDA